MFPSKKDTIMKKKTYIQPQMEAVEIKMQGMIVASPGYGGGGGGGGDAPMMPDFGDTDEPLNFNWQSEL
jgi:hypothetical protein